jgi:hypothetical protein
MRLTIPTNYVVFRALFFAVASGGREISPQKRALAVRAALPLAGEIFGQGSEIKW